MAHVIEICTTTCPKEATWETAIWMAMKRSREDWEANMGEGGRWMSPETDVDHRQVQRTSEAVLPVGPRRKTL